MNKELWQSSYLQMVEVFLRKSSNSGKFSVLFLHGMRFSSKTWSDIGTLQLIDAMGLNAVAIDLPGIMT